MAGRPSIVSDYVSIILRAIENTQNDPARLRSLVYDVARVSLGKHVLLTYHQIGSAGLQQHISDLETAINHAEDIAQTQLLKKEASQKHIADLTKKAQEQIAEISKKAQEQIADLSKQAREQIGDSSKKEVLQEPVADLSKKEPLQEQSAPVLSSNEPSQQVSNLSSNGPSQQVSDLSSNEPWQQVSDLSSNEPSQEQRDAAADLAAQLLDGQVSAVDPSALTVRDRFDETIFDDRPPNKTPVVVQPLPNELYTTRVEILEPIDFRPPAFGSGPKRRRPEFAFGLQLGLAVLIGMAIFAATLIGFEYSGSRFSLRGQVQNASAAVTPASAKPSGADALGFPLPRIYGVYAASEGKLYELDPLPLKVPDPRVAISAMISSPSRVTISNGKLRFVIFRRDLISSAPTEVLVRVVARVARELKFNGAAPPIMSDIEGQWAIRGKSYLFRVAPIGDSPEMIVLDPADPQLSLSPGRYALVIAGKGYDFTIDGQVTDTAQCLERSNVVGGMVYSECGTAPIAN
jgi:hypothetical protein